MDYWGVDVSPVAVGLARQLAEISGVGNRCRFDVWDLDNGLPPGDSVDLLFCYLFREPGLDEAIIDRLAHGGTLAIAVLSEVGAGPGEFRAPSGELKRAFRQLDVLESGEEEGMAWLLGRRQG
jgi:SAM-dependent methyltransferase